MIDRLAEMLLRARVIDRDQLERALEIQGRNGGKIYSILLKLGYLREEDLVEFLSRQLQLPPVSLDAIEVDSEAVALITRATAEKYMAIPYARVNDRIHVAMVDPTDLNALDAIKFSAKLPVEVSITGESQMQRAIETLYDTGSQVRAMLEAFDEDEKIGQEDKDEGPIVKLVNYILGDAIQRGASDIHIEPYDNELRVRYRIDGTLYEMIKPPRKLAAAMANRVRVMARLSATKGNEPQQGVITFMLGRGRGEIVVRVSIFPTVSGEKVTMRLFQESSVQWYLPRLGFDEGTLARFGNSLYGPGLVLVTGPAGSGRTCTLYSALVSRNQPDTNIFTVEDTVEQKLPGINQVTASPKSRVALPSLVEDILATQDTDIIMISEIRDLATAMAAIKAAQAGNLVLAGFCAINAASALKELLALGLQPQRLADNVTFVLAQRLVRRLCPHCKREIEPPEEELISIGVERENVGSFRVYEEVGCDECGNTGFVGRIGLFEAMPLTTKIKELILADASSEKLREEAARQGMAGFATAGRNKIAEGLTTVPEVLRVCGL